MPIQLPDRLFLAWEVSPSLPCLVDNAWTSDVDTVPHPMGHQEKGPWGPALLLNVSFPLPSESSPWITAKPPDLRSPEKLALALTREHLQSEPRWTRAQSWVSTSLTVNPEAEWWPSHPTVHSTTAPTVGSPNCRSWARIHQGGCSPLPQQREL